MSEARSDSRNKESLGRTKIIIRIETQEVQCLIIQEERAEALEGKIAD